MRCEEVGHPLSLRNRTSEESVVRCDNNSQGVESRKIVRGMQEGVSVTYLVQKIALHISRLTGEVTTPARQLIGVLV